MRVPLPAIAVAMTLPLAFAVMSCRSRTHVVTVGFWFDDVAFEVDGYRPETWGGTLTADERQQIEATARAELRQAFGGLRVRFSDSRDAMYGVQVVQRLAPNPWSSGRAFSAAGESRAISMVGGRGSVSFGLLATYAISYAELPWDRPAIVDAIGRGIGRAAAHEFAHQFFPASAIDSRRDIGSYEFHSAARAEQYYGPIRWSHAWPLLVRRFGPLDPAHAVNREE